MNPSIEQLHQQAQQALQQKEYQHAHGLLIALLQQDKFFADAYFLLGIIASDHSNYSKAIQLIEQALKLSTNNAEYLAQLAKHYALEGEHVQAKHNADLALHYVNDSALTLDTIGVTYSKIGLHHHAVSVFKKVIQRDQSNALYFFNLGVAQTFTGDFVNAKASHEKAIQLNPLFSQSYTALSSLGGVKSELYSLTRLKTLYETLSTPDDKLQIGHALSREYEAIEQYDDSFNALSLAKQSKLNAINYDFSEDETMFEQLFSLFNSENVTDKPIEFKGYENEEPIFIVGMPRSGTTLVERILSQHTDVTTAGELEHFGSLFKRFSHSRSSRILDRETIEAASQINYEALGKAYIEHTRVLTGSTPKFIDKMPLNVLYVGFILRALPNAKIVCLDRNPLDTIVSNYRQLFSANAYSYNYAYHLETTAQYYILFNQLVDVWKRLFPENFYQINYQILVNEPEAEAKKLVSFCGLSWQEACLSSNQNAAPVATASAIQVRQPINKKSINNWKKYDKHLHKVKTALSNVNLL